MSARRSAWILGGAGVVAALIVVAVLRGRGNGQEAGGAAQGANANRRQDGAADRVIPVVAAAAAVRDVPIYLDGLGTVTAYKTVNIHAQVERAAGQGQLHAKGSR